MHKLLHSSGLYILIWNSKNRHSIQNLIKYIFSYRQEQDKEVKMYREVYNRHKDFLQACVGDEFEMVGFILMTILGCNKMSRKKE